jgi:DNA-directed RNA polymerase subunit F
MNYLEFSKKIKEKYPQYSDVDDRELAEKIIEKYPEYSDQLHLILSRESKKVSRLRLRLRRLLHQKSLSSLPHFSSLLHY